MIPLNQIQVPEPCGEDWEAMDGDARRRFCAGCGCHVHDLSAMTTQAAQTLLDRADGRLCVRFQTRPDGTVLTQDAPASPKRRASWPGRLATAASWALALVVGGLGLTARADTPPQKPAHAIPKTRGAALAGKRLRVTVGKIAAPRLLPTMGMVSVPREMPPPSPPTTMGAPLATPTMGRSAAPPPKR